MSIDQRKKEGEKKWGPGLLHPLFSQEKDASLLFPHQTNGQLNTVTRLVHCAFSPTVGLLKLAIFKSLQLSTVKYVKIAPCLTMLSSVSGWVGMR